MGWCRERREIREKLGRHDRIRKQEKKERVGSKMSSVVSPVKKDESVKVL